jgi:hypothetical protein
VRVARGGLCAVARVIAWRAMWLTFGVVLAVVLAGAGLLRYVTVGGDARREEVLARGEVATANILAHERTGMAHGRNDILRFHLVVQPAEGEAFEAIADRLVLPSDAPQFQIGATRRVRWLRDGGAVFVELE